MPHISVKVLPLHFRSCCFRLWILFKHFRNFKLPILVDSEAESAVAIGVVVAVVVIVVDAVAAVVVVAAAVVGAAVDAVAAVPIIVTYFLRILLILLKHFSFSSLLVRFSCLESFS